jgi:hypothetical protein
VTDNTARASRYQEVAKDVETWDKQRAADICARAGAMLDPANPAQRALAEAAYTRAGTVYHAISVTAAKDQKREFEAEMRLKAAACFAQVAQPAEEWQRDARDKNAGRAALIYRNLALAAATDGDKPAEATFWLKAAECARQIKVVLADWQQSILTDGPRKAGSIYQQLAVDAATAGDKRAEADALLKTVAAFNLSPLALSSWQEQTRLNGAARAGTLYRELSLEAEAQGNKEEAAELRLAAAQCFRDTTQALKKWQEDARDRFPVWAGAFYAERAAEAKSAGDKRGEAELRLKSMECFNLTTSTLAPWQQDLAAKAPMRAATLYRELALEAEATGRKKDEADFRLKAAAAYRRATGPLAAWQEDIRDRDPARAAALYRALAFEAASDGNKVAETEFRLIAADCL